MRKLQIIGLLLFSIVQLATAQKYISKNGHIWFFSHAPMEDIEAHNRQVVSSIDLSTGDLAFVLLIKAFEFKKALMQVHFNENYMESDKFPKSNFKGKITNLNQINFKKDGTYTAEVSGELTIHGVTKSVTSKGTIEVKGSDIIAKSKFTVEPKDYDIKIPQLVENKIAKVVEITIEAPYTSN